MYDPTKMSFGEARLTAIRNILRSHITDLDLVLMRFDWARNVTPIADTQIEIGDTDRGWDYRTGGAMRFSVCEGGAREGLDFTAERWEVPARYKTTYSTAIFCYFHAEWLRHADPREQGRIREIARATIGDWMRSVFNDQAKYGHAQIRLASTEFGDPAGDLMQQCSVRFGYKGLFPKNFGQTEYVYGINMLHEGSIG